MLKEYMHMKGSIKLLGIALLAATASQVCAADSMYDGWIAKGVRPGMNTQQVYALTGTAIKGSQMAAFDDFYRSHLAKKKSAGGDEGALVGSLLGEAGVDATAAARGRTALLARLQAESEAQRLAAAAKKPAGIPTKTPAELLEEGLVAGGVEGSAAKLLATTFMTAGADDFCPATATLKKDDNMATASAFGGVAAELADVIPALDPAAGTKHFINFGLVGLAIQDVLKDAPDILTALTTKANAGLFNFASVSAHLANADDLATALRDLVVAQYGVHRAAVETIRTNGTAFAPGSDWSAGFAAAEDIDATVLAALGKSATWVALKAKMA